MTAAQPPDAPLPSRAWLMVALLWLVGCLNYLDRVMITTMRGSIVAAIPMSEAEFGLLTSVFLGVYAGLSPLAGFLADRVGRSRVIIASLFTWSVVTWLTAHATTFNELLLTRALMGISEACYIPAALSLIADYHRGRTRSLAIGVHMTGIQIGSAAGGLGGWIAERSNWSHAFTLFGLIGIGYTAVIALLLRDAPAGPLAPTAAPRVRLLPALASLFSRGSFILALLFWGVLGLAGWGVVGWMPTYLTEHFHLTQSAGGFSATLCVNLAALVGVLLGGWWADRWSRGNPRAPILVPFVGLCVGAPAILIAAQTSLLPVALAMLVVFALGKAFSDSNMMPILSLVADPRYRATGYGVLNLFSCAIGGLTIYAGGALRDAQVDVGRVFQCAALTMLVSAALLFCIKPRAAAAA